MRNRALHDALHDFALDAAARLTDELRTGAEIRFEILEESGRGPTLYRYRPLTEEFIAERWPILRDAETCPVAARALGTGAAAYLRVGGQPGTDAEPALQAMLERLYEDATSFAFPEERFERVYADVERTLYEDTTPAIVVAPLQGAILEAARVELGEGLSLARGGALDEPPDALGPPEGPDTDALCVLERDITPDEGLPITEARLRFRRLLTALRLFKAGGLSLGALAWTRTGDGRWQPVPLGSTGSARGDPWVLEPAEAGELRDFASSLERGARSGPLGWALARFEMGCERGLEAEALSDYLLALRALLGAADEAGRASLPLRLAALCAEGSERRALQRRVELALAVERFVMEGGSGEAYLETVGSESPRTLVPELELHLRALLRDLLCGHLDLDLKAMADDILLEAPERLEIEAHDLREEEQPEAGAPEMDLADAEPEDPELVHASQGPDPAEPSRGSPGAPEPPTSPPGPGPSEGVTPSDDWAFEREPLGSTLPADEDPASYSAPV